MTFASLAEELFADYGQNLPFARMNDADRQRLVTAFLTDYREPRETLFSALQKQLDQEWRRHLNFRSHEERRP